MQCAMVGIHHHLFFRSTVDGMWVVSRLGLLNIVLKSLFLIFKTSFPEKQMLKNNQEESWALIPLFHKYLLSTHCVLEWSFLFLSWVEPLKTRWHPTSYRKPFAMASNSQWHDPARKSRGRSSRTHRRHGAHTAGLALAPSLRSFSWGCLWGQALGLMFRCLLQCDVSIRHITKLTKEDFNLAGAQL